MTRVIYLCLFMLCFLQCNPDKALVDGAPGPYFDLEEWMSLEFIADKEIRSISKTLVVQDEEENQTISEYNVTEDLKSWKGLNWNDTRLYGTYAVDTINTGPQSKTIQYRSLNNTNSVSQAYIVYEANKVSTVQIVSDQKSVVSSSRKEYVLQMNEGYSIRYCDTLFWAKGNCTLVEVAF